MTRQSGSKPIFRCICNHPKECYGVTSTFYLLKDKRGCFVELPPTKMERAVAAAGTEDDGGDDKGWGKGRELVLSLKLRRAYLRHLQVHDKTIQTDKDHAFHVALHHFPPLVAEDSHRSEECAQIATICRTRESTSDDRSTMQEDVEDQEDNDDDRVPGAKNVMFVVPNYPFGKAKDDAQLAYAEKKKGCTSPSLSVDTASVTTEASSQEAHLLQRSSISSSTTTTTTTTDIGITANNTLADSDIDASCSFEMASTANTSSQVTSPYPPPTAATNKEAAQKQGLSSAPVAATTSQETKNHKGNQHYDFLVSSFRSRTVGNCAGLQDVDEYYDTVGKNDIILGHNTGPFDLDEAMSRWEESHLRVAPTSPPRPSTLLTRGSSGPIDLDNWSVSSSEDEQEGGGERPITEKTPSSKAISSQGRALQSSGPIDLDISWSESESESKSIKETTRITSADSIDLATTEVAEATVSPQSVSNIAPSKGLEDLAPSVEKQNSDNIGPPDHLNIRSSSGVLTTNINTNHIDNANDATLSPSVSTTEPAGLDICWSESKSETEPESIPEKLVGVKIENSSCSAAFKSEAKTEPIRTNPDIREDPSPTLLDLGICNIEEAEAKSEEEELSFLSAASTEPRSEVPTTQTSFHSTVPPEEVNVETDSAHKIQEEANTMTIVGEVDQAAIGSEASRYIDKEESPDHTGQNPTQVSKHLASSSRTSPEVLLSKPHAHLGISSRRSKRDKERIMTSNSDESTFHRCKSPPAPVGLSPAPTEIEKPTLLSQVTTLLNQVSSAGEILADAKLNHQEDFDDDFYFRDTISVPSTLSEVNPEEVKPAVANKQCLNSSCKIVSQPLEAVTNDGDNPATADTEEEITLIDTDDGQVYKINSPQVPNYAPMGDSGTRNPQTSESPAQKLCPPSLLTLDSRQSNGGSSQKTDIAAKDESLEKRPRNKKEEEGIASNSEFVEHKEKPPIPLSQDSATAFSEPPRKSKTNSNELEGKSKSPQQLNGPLGVGESKVKKTESRGPLRNNNTIKASKVKVWVPVLDFGQKNHRSIPKPSRVTAKECLEMKPTDIKEKVISINTDFGEHKDNPSIARTEYKVKEQEEQSPAQQSERGERKEKKQETRESNDGTVSLINRSTRAKEFELRQSSLDGLQKPRNRWFKMFYRQAESENEEKPLIDDGQEETEIECKLLNDLDEKSDNALTMSASSFNDTNAQLPKRNRDFWNSFPADESDSDQRPLLLSSGAEIPSVLENNSSSVVNGNSPPPSSDLGTIWSDDESEQESGSEPTSEDNLLQPDTILSEWDEPNQTMNDVLMSKKPLVIDPYVKEQRSNQKVEYRDIMSNNSKISVIKIIRPINDKSVAVTGGKTSINDLSHDLTTPVRTAVMSNKQKPILSLPQPLPEPPKHSSIKQVIKSPPTLAKPLQPPSTLSNCPPNKDSLVKPLQNSFESVNQGERAFSNNPTNNPPLQKGPGPPTSIIVTSSHDVNASLERSRPLATETVPLNKNSSELCDLNTPGESHSESKMPEFAKPPRPNRSSSFESKLPLQNLRPPDSPLSFNSSFQVPDMQGMCGSDAESEMTPIIANTSPKTTYGSDAESDMTPTVANPRHKTRVKMPVKKKETKPDEKNTTTPMNVAQTRSSSSRVENIVGGAADDSNVDGTFGYSFLRWALNGNSDFWDAMTGSFCGGGGCFPATE